MSRINRTPRFNVNAETSQFYSEVARQVNGLSEGRMASRYNARTSAPTTETWATGDFVPNSNPTQLGTSGNLYFIDGWKCVAGGTPGTWVESRYMTADVSGGGGGGGSATWTEVEIDFGATPVYDAAFTITDASINASSKVAVVPSGKAATGRTSDDWQWDMGMFVARPGAGSAACYGHFFPGPIVGRRKLQYQIG